MPRKLPPIREAIGIKKRRIGRQRSEAEPFVVCPVCGQAFDMRDLEQAVHHASEAHEPLDVDV